MEVIQIRVLPRLIPNSPVKPYEGSMMVLAV